MSISRVWVESGCISCHLSEDTCPEVFVVKGNGAEVRPGADLVKNDALIREMADACPVSVIKFEEA